jgi:hypothetical protein
MKLFIAVRPVLQVSLLGIVIVAMSVGCNREGEEVKQARDAIRQHAAKQNPSFGAGDIRFSGIIDGGDGCMCLKVCNSKGENCTPCVCDPANCGSCD